MKKLFMTALVAMSLFGTTFAQEQESELKPVLDRKHEIRLDALEVLAIITLEFNYEYVISKYSGAGVALSVNLSDDNDFEFDQKFALTPFYRQYFFNEKEYGARGIFVEGMMQLASGESNDFNFNPETNTTIEENENWFNVGAGLSVGKKWVSNSGFVFEVSAGGGRYFAGGDNQPDGFFRGGILIGYRL